MLLDHVHRIGPRGFEVFLKALRTYQPEVYTRPTREMVIVPRENDKNELLYLKLNLNVVLAVTKKTWMMGVKIASEMEQFSPEKKVLLISIEDLYKANYFNALIKALKSEDFSFISIWVL